MGSYRRLVMRESRVRERERERERERGGERGWIAQGDIKRVLNTLLIKLNMAV